MHKLTSLSTISASQKFIIQHYENWPYLQIQHTQISQLIISTAQMCITYVIDTLHGFLIDHLNQNDRS